MIKKILLVIIFLHLPAWGASIQERQELYQEGMAVCRHQQTPCIIQEYKSIIGNAETNYNKISVMTNISEPLTKDELRSILYHEIAHVILQHSNKGIIWQQSIRNSGREPSKAEIKQFRNTQEFDADKFMCYLLWRYGKPNLFEQALTKIDNPDYYYKDSISHPSTYERVLRVRAYKKLYGN